MHRRSFTSLVVVFMFALSIIPLSALAGRQRQPVAFIDPQVQQAITRDGTTTFWVILRQKADLSAAPSMRNWNERGRFVVDQLRAIADNTQSGLRVELNNAKVRFRPFWLANAIQVTAGMVVLNRIAARPEVERIIPSRTYAIPTPMKGSEVARVNSTEWNIDRIGAPQVWQAFGDTGDGIVIANIDTGVEYTHAALVNQYRGNLGGGVFDHNYNWYDPSNVCGSPSTAPCDNYGHGTHTMGTMVGDDGGTNQIGVAPGARWIAAKGCETGDCSDFALLAAGQWILAPTDLNGQNPRPDLRPNIVNNSWGAYGNDPFYKAIVQAWVASGIFPAFAAGNNGSGCGTLGSPGDYAESYAAGAFDNADQIAWFSSRGPVMSGYPYPYPDPNAAPKPNIAAPGVDVRSSVPGNGYAVNSGTSMASPHVAAAVALIWAAAPSLIGDIENTRALLNQTAVDTSDLACGGTAENNNVWGEGKLDVYAAVNLAPRGPVATLIGTVTDSRGSPLSGVNLKATGPFTRTTMTGMDGTYKLRLPIGSYTVEARRFGYLPLITTTADLTENTTTTLDLALVTAPAFPVSGTVYSYFGTPLRGAAVMIADTPISSTITDANGTFSFAAVPVGAYNLVVGGVGCSAELTTALVVDAAKALELTLPQKSDSFGYRCANNTPNYVPGREPLNLNGSSSADIQLPFVFPFYGQGYSSASVNSSGYITFQAGSYAYSNDNIPSIAQPNAAIYPFWDDLYFYSDSAVYVRAAGQSPTRTLVIEWRNVGFWYGNSTERVSFTVTLFENGVIQTQYKDLAATALERGGRATIGIENAWGDVAIQHSYNQAAMGGPTYAVRYYKPGTAVVSGVVTDANTSKPVAGAFVTVFQNGAQVASSYTSQAGGYAFQLPLGSYTLEFATYNYLQQVAAVVLDTEYGVVAQDMALISGLPVLSNWNFAVIAPKNEQRTRTFTLANAGSAQLNWQLVATNAPWLMVAPAQGVLEIGETVTITMDINTQRLAPALYNGYLNLFSDSATSVMQIPVNLIVPAYQRLVNAGGSAYTDSEGNQWLADHRYVAGSWGYINGGTVLTVTNAIKRTSDDFRFQSQRQNPYAYRFNHLPAGTYEVELDFAELDGKYLGQRIFDVVINDQLVLPAHDIAYAVGLYTAEKQTFFVSVRENGNIDVRLVPRVGFSKPVVNALRIVHRPDR